MRNFTKIINRHIQFSSLEVCVCRAPQAKIDNRTDVTPVMKFLAMGPPVKNPWNKLLPCFFQRALSQVVNEIGMT